MSLPPFTYQEPATVREACQMLQAFGNTAALVAGGTDLLVKMKNRVIQPTTLVSLTEIQESRRITINDQEICLGSCCSVARLAESEEIRFLFPALASAASELGSPAVRNLATVGGNIVTASPAADLPTALIAHGARVRLIGSDAERSLNLETFFQGPGSTDIAADEILAEICLEKPKKGTGSAFFKLGTRKALQISVVNGACSLSLDPERGIITQARVVLGAVAPTHVRSFSAEQLLTGEQPGASLFEEAGRAAARDCSPIDDLRGSGAYRRDMVEMMTRRTLQAALEKARNPLMGT